MQIILTKEEFDKMVDRTKIDKAFEKMQKSIAANAQFNGIYLELNAQTFSNIMNEFQKDIKVCL